MDDDVPQLLRGRRYDAALERLQERYEQKVFRLAMTILRDAGRAEEVTQDVFLKLWRALPAYDGRAAVSTWLYTIARNTCLTVLRAEAYRRTMPLDDVAAPSREEGSRLDVQGALTKLPDIQRDVVTLFYWEDRSVAEVARMLDLPEGTVKSHLHRARRTLGKMLG